MSFRPLTYAENSTLQRCLDHRQLTSHPFAFSLLISAYVVADYFFQKATAPPPSRRTFAPKVKYTEAGDIGDQMPSAKVKGGHH